MRSILLFVILFFISTPFFAQNEYEKAYYIDHQGVKTEGFIKVVNFGDVNSPSFTFLNFKKELTSEDIKIPIQNVETFGIGEEMKYQRCKVQMDDVNLYKHYDTNKDLSLVSANLFLNVLVEGKATLYSFTSVKGNKYFFKVDGLNDNVIQLIYKKYLVQEEKEKENSSFREQLYKNVICDGQSYSDFLDIKYDRKQLINVFENYNKCQNSNYIVYGEKFIKKSKFNFTGFAGINYVKFNMNGVDPATNPERGMSYDFGGEVEVVMPNEKWAFFVSVACDITNDITIYGEEVLSSGNTALKKTDYTINCNGINVVIGARFYQEINNSNKLFFDGSLLMNNPFGEINKNYVLTNRTIDDYVYATQIYELSSSFCFRLGIGYLFNNKFGIEFNLDTNKDLLSSSTNISTEYKTMGLNFRYTFN